MSNKKIIIISLTAVVFCIAAYLCYIMIAGWQQKRTGADVNQDLITLQVKNDKLKRELSALEEEISRLKGSKDISARLEEVFGNKSSLLSLGKNNLNFKEIEELVTGFFSYIDEKGYVERNGLTGSAYSQYEILENDLSATAPISSGETENLFNLAQNASHFYRVSGKQRLFLVRDILTDESDIIEFAMKTFYTWYTYENDNGKRMKERPSLKVMYDYSSFFLNSLGGRGYLLRRDSKIRILTNFYSILVIDIAIDKKLNLNGIDIRPFIKANYDEINDNLSLNDKMEYLTELDKLKIKYKIP
jgi:hypothetical protein